MNGQDYGFCVSHCEKYINLNKINASNFRNKNLPTGISFSKKELCIYGVTFKKLIDIAKWQNQTRKNGQTYTQLKERNIYSKCFNNNCVGVYAIVENSNKVIYIGETGKGIKTRLTQYFKPQGQSTNTRIHDEILCKLSSGKEISVYFYPTTYHKGVEEYLLKEYVGKNKSSKINLDNTLMPKVKIKKGVPNCMLVNKK